MHKQCFPGFKSQLNKTTMRSVLFISAFLILVIGFISCKKEDNINGCFPEAATKRQIIEKPAVIKVTATIYSVYIVEQGSIDSKLIPCNLPADFVQNDLQVTISGDVKDTPMDSGPCCSDNFVITKITK